MKSKFVKISVALLAVSVSIATASTALSEKRSEDIRDYSFLGPKRDMPKFEGVKMIDRQGNRQSCYIDTVYVNPGKRVKSIYACWSDKVSE